MSKKPKGQVAYIHMGPWPMYVGYTDSVKAFQREAARLDPSYPKWTMGRGHLATTHTLHRGDHTIVIVVGRPLAPDEDDPFFLSVLAHEAIHVLQSLRKVVESKRLGTEAEAYLMQYLVLQMWTIASGDRAIMGHVP